MPADLRHLYSSLADDVDAGTLPPAGSLRQRADRRARAVAAAACVAVSVVVGATAFAANALLTRDAMPPIGPPSPSVTTPAPTRTSQPSPTPSSTPTGTPTPTSSTSTRVPIPPIPNSAFFTTPAATSDDVPASESRNVPPLPSLCGAPFNSEAAIGQRRGRHLIYYRADRPPDEIPQGTIDHTITVYQPGGSAQAMRDLRAALATCPSETEGPATVRYERRTATARGDDSVLLRLRWTAPPSTEPMTATAWTTLVSVVRIGDVVTVFFVQGWEGIDADPVLADDYLRLAVNAINAWR